MWENILTPNAFNLKGAFVVGNQSSGMSWNRYLDEIHVVGIDPRREIGFFNCSLNVKQSLETHF